MSNIAAGSKVSLSGWVNFVDCDGNVNLKPDRSSIEVLEQMPTVGDVVSRFATNELGQILTISCGQYQLRLAEQVTRFLYRWEFRCANKVEVARFYAQDKEFEAKRKQAKLNKLIAEMSSSEIFDVMSSICATAMTKREQEKKQKEDEEQTKKEDEKKEDEKKKQKEDEKEIKEKDEKKQDE